MSLSRIGKLFLATVLISIHMVGCFLAQIRTEETTAHATYGATLLLNWNDLDLTGAYFKKHTSLRVPAWPFYVLGAAGAGVAGYYLFQGSPDLPAIEARDDVVFASCLSSVSVNVLTNDIGEGLVVAGVSGVPAGIGVEMGSGGLLQIADVGSTSFSFSYTIRDIHGQRSVGEVRVEVQVSALLVVDDEAQVVAGGSVELNVLSNDTGCNGTGVLIRTWTATDDCGKSSSCEQRITIQDVTAPVITCPPNVTIECTDSTSPDETGTATATDNCGSVLIDYADITDGPDDCSAVKVITRTWTATDLCGNSSSCSQTITVNPQQMSTITCPSDVTIECNESREPSNTGNPNGSTTCSIGELTFNFSDVEDLGDCGGTGTISRTWRVRDGCNLENSCTQIIIVIDSQGPELAGLPDNASVTCDAVPDVPTVTASDNCTECPITVNFSQTITEGACPDSYTIVRTWSAADACGNVAEQSQTITVIDNIPPAITCPSGITESCYTDTNPSATGSAIAVDNCSDVESIVLDYTDNVAGMSCNGTVGILNRIWSHRCLRQ